MTMRRILWAVFALAVMHQPAFAQTPSGQTLRIALRQDLDIMDPTLATTYVGRIVFGGLCDKLFDIDEKLNIVPQLATGYEWTDPKTLVIHLRQGVKFQDDEVFDAEAAKATFERYLTLPGSYRKSELGLIDHIDIIDPATIRIGLKAASGAFLAQLTDRSGMILAPKAAAQAGKDFAQHPVCTGPFKFVERVPQDHVTLERFPGYWDNKDIHFDRVVYQILVDSSVRLANLKAGTVDLSENIVPTDAAAVKADPKLRLVLSELAGLFRHHQQPGQWPAGEEPLRPKRAGPPGVRPGDRSQGAGRCGLQRHVRAHRAGGAEQFAVLRCHAEAARARCGKGQGVAATGRRASACQA